MADYLGPQASFTTDPVGALLGAMGFGPGPSWSPQQEADEQEQTRQARIQNAVKRINSIFGSSKRQKQYSTLANATTQHYVDALNKQRTNALNQMRFGLASRGLTGGSEAAYQNEQAGEDYTKGLLRAGNIGQNAAAQLRAADEATKANLLSLAREGASAGTSAQRAGESLLANLQNAQTQGQLQDLGDMFANLGSIYENQQAYQNQRALEQQQHQLLYSLTGRY